MRALAYVLSIIDNSLANVNFKLKLATKLAGQIVSRGANQIFKQIAQ